MNNGPDYLELWMTTQKEFLGKWVEGTRQFQNVFSDFMSGEKTAGKKGLEVFDIYSSWLTTTADYFARQKQTGDFRIIEETMRKLFGDSNVYSRLYDVWLSIFRGAQGKTLQPDSYLKLLDPANYMEILNKFFSVGPLSSVTEFYKQAAGITNISMESVKEFSGPWAEAFRRNWQNLTQFAEGRVGDSVLKGFHNVFNAFDATFGKGLHMPAVWKDREKIELYLKSFDDLAYFLEKNIEYLYIMYSTGFRAMGRVIESVAREMKDGGGICSFNEFLDIWTQENEKTFRELFETEEFARLQGEFLDAAMNVRRHFFKLMELYLFDFPVAVRSEMDDLYKTVYDLKKKVKGLQKTIKTSQMKGVTL